MPEGEIMMRTCKALAVLSILSVLGCGGGGGGGSGGSDGSRKSTGPITGGGSSFIAPMMKEWAGTYLKAEGVQVDYTSSGSSDGISKMIDKKNDFGCTDAPMNEEQMARATAEGGAVLHIPLVMGAVVPLYNLPGVDKTLRFTGPVLADIFLGKIKKWNDPALGKINPGVKLPDLEIVPIHRADGSGTTFIFTDYLSKVSPEWAKGPGKGQEVKWAGGQGAIKNPGVAGMITRTAGSIGYVELIYALSENKKFGAVQNKAGEFLEGSLEGVTAAAREALSEIPEDLRFSLTDAPGKDTYPISGTTWAVFYVKQPNPDKAAALEHLFSWLTADQAQSMVKNKQYARLPKELVSRVEKQLERLKTGS
jgi:phosphate transport system substrate-binding protein